MLDIRNACKTFAAGTENALSVLDGLNLVVREGELVTIIGANGAGKSTLFNAIAGTLSLDRGQIILDQQNITDWPVHKRSRQIGRVFQNPQLGTSPHLTIAENLALAYNQRRGIGLRFALRRRDLAVLREKLATVGMGLEDRLDTPVGLLSGGQRQALVLLMTTINKPQLLLLDEHTAALDPAGAERILELTSAIVRRDRITTLMITHNLKDALSIGDRTLMLEKGKVLLDLSGAERVSMTVADLLARYARGSGRELADERLLLSQAGQRS